MNVYDNAGAYTGFILKGTITIPNNPPTVGTITPSSGTFQPNTPLTFTTTYSDPDGWQNLNYVYLLFNTTVNGSNCCYVYYNQNTNLLYLRNDANTAALGGFTPGSANVIENSYAKLDCSKTTVSGSGTTLTINWSIVFKTTFSGTKNSYLDATDDAGAYTGFIKKGTITIPNNPPTVGTITPSSGTFQPNTPLTFITTYSDPDGWQNLNYVYLLFNTSVNGSNCFYGYYNQNTNLLYLRNDANTAGLGGFAVGSNNIIENSYAKLDCSKTTVSGSGTTLTINWGIVFKTTFSGTKNSYLDATDDAGAYTGFIKK